MASSSNVIDFQPRHDKRSNVRYVDGATLYAFPEQGMSTTTIFDSPKSYMDALIEVNRQAGLILAATVALHLRVFECSLLHPPKDGATRCATLPPAQREPSPNTPPRPDVL